MPSSYTLSLRLTLQATGENNNTWGVILNQGVFGLVDYAIAGRLAFVLSGSKTLTTALGATDESRAAMLDVTGGSGGQIVLPAVSKGYFIRNNAAGLLTVSQGGPVVANFQPGDMGPVFTDGAGAVFQILLGNLPLRDYITLAIASAAAANLPPAFGNTGKVLAVQNVPPETWLPTQLTTAYLSDFAAKMAAHDALAIAMAVSL